MTITYSCFFFCIKLNKCLSVYCGPFRGHHLKNLMAWLRGENQCEMIIEIYRGVLIAFENQKCCENGVNFHQNPMA